MALFNEANTFRHCVRDLVKSIDVQFVPGNEPSRTHLVLLEGPVKAALIRLNLEIDADRKKVDEVIQTLRAISSARASSPSTKRSGPECGKRGHQATYCGQLSGSGGAFSSSAAS